MELLSMPSEPQSDAERYMTGNLVVLYQYMPGLFPRDTLHRLWQMVENEGEIKRLFHANFWGPQATAFDIRSDLGEFLSFFGPNSGKLLTLVQAVDGEIAGFFWLDDIVPQHKAAVNLFFRRGFRGEYAREAGQLFREYATRFLGFKTLWAATPWENVASFAREMGFEDIARLPEYEIFEGKPQDVLVLRYVRPTDD